MLYALIAVSVFLYGLKPSSNNGLAAAKPTDPAAGVRPLAAAMQDGPAGPMTSCFSLSGNCRPLRAGERGWRCNVCGGWRAATPFAIGGCWPCKLPNDQDRPEQ